MLRLSERTPGFVALTSLVRFGKEAQQICDEAFTDRFGDVLEALPCAQGSGFGQVPWVAGPLWWSSILLT